MGLVELPAVGDIVTYRDDGANGRVVEPCRYEDGIVYAHIEWGDFEPSGWFALQRLVWDKHKYPLDESWFPRRRSVSPPAQIPGEL